MLFVWNFITAVVDERTWAQEQLGDFAHPERFPDWPDRYRVQMQYRGFRRARQSDIVANAGGRNQDWKKSRAWERIRGGCS